MSNLFSWLFNSANSLEKPDPWFVDWVGFGRKTTSGTTVSSESSLTVGSVFACVRNLSEDLAALPTILYERMDAGGKRRADDMPQYSLLHDQPNNEQTPMLFKSTLLSWAILRGNGYAEIVRSGSEPRELHLIHPSRVTVKRTPGGALAYEVRASANNAFGVTVGGEFVEMGPDDLLHIQGYTEDGILGRVMSYLARESIGLAKAAETYAASFFGNGATLGGLLKHPGQLSDPARNNLRESWNQMHQGPDKAHNVAILEEGLSWEKTDATPKESQGIEYRSFQVEEIARWFRMPPHKIGHLARSTFSNIEHQAIEYVQDTLSPWCVRMEQELSRKLLRPDDRKTYFFETLLDARLRGDAPTRTAALAQQFLNGALTLNEWRAIENRNPLPADQGDVHFVPLNLTPIEKAIEEKDEPAAAVPPPFPPKPPAPPPEEEKPDDMEHEDGAMDEEEIDAAAAMLPVFTDAFARVQTWAAKSHAGEAKVREYMAAAITPPAVTLASLARLTIDAANAAASFAAHCQLDPSHQPEALAAQFIAALSKEAQHE